jgi:hypothetical protein
MGVVIPIEITRQKLHHRQWSRIPRQGNNNTQNHKVYKIVKTANIQKDFRFMPSEQRALSTEAEGVDNDPFTSHPDFPL